MMTHVDDVVANNEFQVEVLAIGSVPDVFQGSWINRANEGGQLHVVHLPKSDNLRQWPILIALRTHQLIAIITRQVQHRSKLKADKWLMVFASQTNKWTNISFF